MTNSQEPLIKRPTDLIIDFPQLDKSTETDRFPYQIHSKPKKKYPKASLTLLCCMISILSTAFLIWGLALGGLARLN